MTGADSAKLGPKQFELLARVCKTNGGGIYFHDIGYESKVVRRLESLGLIQGKLNHDGWIVHTRKGLDLYRAELSKETSK